MSKSEDVENLSQEFADLLSHRSMRQFALALKQRRVARQQQLQFTNALQAKYSADEETEPSPIRIREFIQTIGERSRGARRSFQTTPQKLAKAISFQISPEVSESEELEISSRKSSFDISSEIAQGKSLASSSEFRDSPLSEDTGQFNSLNFFKPGSRSSNEIQELESKVNQSNFQILESSVQGFLSNILNIRIPGVRVYANSLSDSLVQKYHADALAYPDKILFRLGKYNPYKITGLALLGHELTHLEQFRHQDRSPTEDSAIAETEALASERKIFRYISNQQGYLETIKPLGLTSDIDRVSDSSPIATQSTTSSRESAQSLSIPQAALSDRDISLPLAPPLVNSHPSLSEMQLDLIKNEVYQDLRQRLRTEFERGS